MEPRLPLPTDNIYKFYAIFGLVLLVAGMFLLFQVYESHNEREFTTYVELATLDAVSAPTPEQAAHRKVLEARRDIGRRNKEFFNPLLGSVMGVAIALMVYGFYKWHTFIQPLQDKLFLKQLEKLEQDLKAGLRPQWKRKR